MVYSIFSTIGGYTAIIFLLKVLAIWTIEVSGLITKSLSFIKRAVSKILVMLLGM